MAGTAIADFTDKDNIRIGEDRPITITVDDGTVGSPPSGMENWTYEWYLRAGPAGRVVVRKHTADMTINETTGDVSFDLLAQDTEGLYPGRYEHALWRRDPDAQETLSEGMFILKANAGTA